MELLFTDRILPYDDQRINVFAVDCEIVHGQCKLEIHSTPAMVWRAGILFQLYQRPIAGADGYSTSILPYILGDDMSN